MKQFTRFLFLALVAFLVACSGSGTQVAGNDGGISGTGDGSSKSTISGSAYKGPLIKGSLIKIKQVVDGIIGKDEVSFNLLSNQGDYAFYFDPEKYDNSIVSITAKGQFYDENTALFSNEEVELKALISSDLSSEKPQTIYINSLTHLAHDYMLLLLSKGISYEKARPQAEQRVLILLSALTGKIKITQPFSDISLLAPANDKIKDNGFLLYISALISKAASIEQRTDTNATVQSLFDRLIQNVAADAQMDTATLELLQQAHEQLDANAIQQNLSSVLVDSAVASITATVDQIEPGLNQPTGLHTVSIAGPPAVQRFCYEGITDCSTEPATGNVNNNGMYTYELQTALQGTDFAAARSFKTARNNISVSAGFYNPSTNYEARLRKVWPDGQFSAWSTISFTAPP